MNFGPYPGVPGMRVQNGPFGLVAPMFYDPYRQHYLLQDHFHAHPTAMHQPAGQVQQPDDAPIAGPSLTKATKPGKAAGNVSVETEVVFGSTSFSYLG